MIDKELNDIVRRLETVEWHQTKLGPQWYYAEEGLYVLKCHAGAVNEHLILVRAKDRDEALEKVFR